MMTSERQVDYLANTVLVEVAPARYELRDHKGMKLTSIIAPDDAAAKEAAANWSRRAWEESRHGPS